MAKKTVKDLCEVVKNLTDKLECLENAQEAKIRKLETRIVSLEKQKNVSFERNACIDSPGFKCKECNETFSKKHSLKSHILAKAVFL